MSDVIDLLIVGGGINGAGVAADASGRGLSVLLCEQGDLASATSSASSKLIHGGLRYLEHWHFRLVHEALVEREVLLRKAPHLIQPQRFILPHRPHLRPKWLIRTGLFLYDHLAKRGQLPTSRALPLLANANNPLQDSLDYGFQYFDCKVDDARLVVANAMQARQQGATILTRTRCQTAHRQDGLWHVVLEDINSGMRHQYRAKALLNTCGPWAQSFIEKRLKLNSPRHIRLIKGSHFIVKKLYSGEQAYLLQNDDQRIVFVIPFCGDFTLVGTTDTEYKGDPSAAAMDSNEEGYLLEVINACFTRQLSRRDILWRYAGVRPLCDDESAKASAISRDYTLELEVGDDGSAPLLSVFGGKITTYRKLAETVLAQLKPFLPEMAPDWTADALLPGGDISGDIGGSGTEAYAQWLHTQMNNYPWLPSTLLSRLGRAYGSQLSEVLGEARDMADMGPCFGADLYQREVEYLLEKEWACSGEDILWRRSKLGLYFAASQVEALDTFVGELTQARLR
ncbi:MAG: glycerol-3-phosphate dehydrogenase [Gammaproteobacteria bacterium]|nr:glycerol-3-phosphate dehydrogenase [Gammaproteobacteria bacterium]MBQ0840633.1 glycerol-3-phosphate dehydrogenase [Gammaproteobacteria bacterium]